MTAIAPFAFDRGVTLAGAKRAMVQLFVQAGFDTPDLDARVLMCAILGIDAVTLIVNPDRKLGSTAKARALTSAANRRLAREPVSRILGVRDFYGRTFKVSPATLDPRPDTETVIEAVLAHVAAQSLATAPLRIIDVGTGTGCLLITLLAELPHATGLGTDVSAPALRVARANAKNHGLVSRSMWTIEDGLEAIEGPFDLLVTNPPYIRTRDIVSLAPEVATHDPYLALDGGPDGLAIYRRLIEKIPLVVPMGCVVFEIGHDQADDVAALLRAQGGPRGWPAPQVFKDLAGHPRCVTQITLC
jgi:release factor glutamine methyltransferase